MAAATGLSLAACGAAQQITAGAKLEGAFGKLDKATAITVALKLDTTPGEILELDKRDGGDGPKLGSDEAKAIAGLSVKVSMSADKPLKDVLDAASGSAGAKPDPSLNMDVTVRTGTGEDVLDYRTVAGKNYLKVGVQAIDALSGGSGDAGGPSLAEMQSELEQMPPSMAPFKNLLGGKWVEIDPAKFADFAKNMGSTPEATPSAMPTLDAGTQKKLKDALASVLSKHASFSDKGVSGGLLTIEVQANDPRGLIVDMEKQVLPLFKGVVPGLPDKLPTTAPTDAPTTPIVATIQLNDAEGTLNNVSFDFGQLDTGHKDTHLAAKLTFEDKATQATAPAGALLFDPSTLGS